MENVVKKKIAECLIIIMVITKATYSNMAPNIGEKFKQYDINLYLAVRHNIVPQIYADENNNMWRNRQSASKFRESQCKQ